MNQGLVILDRDGVLNRMVVNPDHGLIDSPLHPDQVEILPEVAESLKALTECGYVLAVATNQPAAAKGKTSKSNLIATHEKVLHLAQSKGGKISLDKICFHRSEDRCNCRKPNIQMLQEISQELGFKDKSKIWMIGDGATDILAGSRYGVQTAFLGPKKLDAIRVFDELGCRPDFWADGLRDFVQFILSGGEEMEQEFTKLYLQESHRIIDELSVLDIESVANGLAQARDKGGRLFILGVGGSAGHASHAVNDFRKICNFEAYSPTDNVSELTARINDEGWDGCFSEWLKGSRINEKDAVLVFSVGGGNAEKNVSMNLVRALQTAKEVKASIYGITGKDGGFTKTAANACVVIPVVSDDRITPHTEGFCAVVWHLLVSHPALKKQKTKWESVR